MFPDAWAAGLGVVDLRFRAEGDSLQVVAGQTAVAERRDGAVLQAWGLLMETAAVLQAPKDEVRPETYQPGASRPELPAATDQTAASADAASGLSYLESDLPADAALEQWAAAAVAQ